MAVEDCYGGQLRCRIEKEGRDRMRGDSYESKPEIDRFHENLSLNRKNYVF